MKKRITIGALLAFATMLVVYGKESERPSGAADNSGADSVGETKVFTLPGGVHMEMVYVAPGSFQMGSENGVDDEKPVHKVTLTNGYWIGKYPVTQAQWNTLVSAMDVSFGGGRPVAFFSRNGIGRDLVSGMDTSDFPMENISWNDCTALVAALNKADREGWRWSLPTESQWEFAARGGNKSRGYTYSGGNDMDVVGWYYENSGKMKLYDSDFDLDKLQGNKCRPHAVKEKDVGNELGIVGMSGNVWEWCNDWYGGNYYSTSPTENPQGPATGGSRVLRGGGWISRMRYCHSVYRNWSNPVHRGDDYGLRLCCTAGPRKSGAEQEKSQAVAQDDRGGADRRDDAGVPRDDANVLHNDNTSVVRDNTSVVRGVLPKNPRHGQVARLRLPGGAMMEMIYVAPGSFAMGSPASEAGRFRDETQHRVTLAKGYWLGKYEVTQAQWQSVMGGCPSLFPGDNRPVDNVSWEDCQIFVSTINSQLNCGARLPTEAEWEYACRAGSTGPYAGDGYLDDMGWYDDNSNMTHPVGQKHANAWGFHDTHGNVWEWCADWYGEYGRAATDPRGPASGKSRVLRGGSWSRSARGCRSAYRGRYNPGRRVCSYGLRLCCSAEPRER